MSDLCPIGVYGAENAPYVEKVIKATAYILSLLNSNATPPDRVLIESRNRTIYERYQSGETQADLAREFGVSYQRIHQIIEHFAQTQKRGEK